MKRAILSDIHGNLEALQAVLADVQTQNVDEIYCLGDIVGYGPNPRECIDVVMTFNGCILGNHDQGALFDPEGFSSGAERAIFWTRQQLEFGSDDPAEAEQIVRRWKFICELPRNLRQKGMLYVHGSARNPLNEYVFPEDVYNARKLDKIFGLIERHCFQGHTHIPGVFTDKNKFLQPHDIGYQYRLDAAKAMVNVGSVGQPRDGDSRACYVVLEIAGASDGAGSSGPAGAGAAESIPEITVNFRRVEYPLAQTMEKIYAIPELDNFLADRLREGR